VRGRYSLHFKNIFIRLINKHSYYNVNVKGREIKDAIWLYKYPLVESHSIAGLLCFYNEKFDIYIDGVKE
jgi:uncharacterized protein (DUF427 family)